MRFIDALQFEVVLGGAEKITESGRSTNPKFPVELS